METDNNQKMQENMRLAEDLILNYSQKHYYDTSFLFGTENQEGVNRVISYKDKDVLTVASSGDQYLSAIYYGANNVDLYDINPLSKPITYLKIASMLTLSYEDFLCFLIPTYQEKSDPCFSKFKPKYDITSFFWNLQTLKKIIPNLPSDVAYFWENIMFLAKKHKYGAFVNPVHFSAYKENVFQGMAFYSSEKEYYKLQCLLRKRDYPKFMETDLLQIGTVLTDSYDLLYLSNIIGCLVAMELQQYTQIYSGFKSAVETKFIFMITKAIMPYLKNNGTILFDYRPNTWKDETSGFLFSNPCFNVSEIPAKFPPIYNEFKDGKTDLVLTYKPSDNNNIFNF